MRCRGAGGSVDGGGTSDGGGSGGGGSGGDGSSAADAEAEETVPLLLFSQPISLKDMIEHALNLGEYTTFSGIMRMKAKQVRARAQADTETCTRARRRPSERRGGGEGLLVRCCLLRHC